MGKAEKKLFNSLDVSPASSSSISQSNNQLRKRMIAAMIEHKGYIGRFEFDVITENFHGKASNISDFIFFEGKTVEKTTKVFVEAVNAYLLQCEKNGTLPENPPADANEWERALMK